MFEDHNTRRGLPEGWRPSTVKRVRRTSAQLAQIDDAIVAVLVDEHPATVRSVFYRVTSMGVVDKSENGYRLIGRQLLKLRRGGSIPFGWITDGTRYVLHGAAYDSAEDAIATTASFYRRRVWGTQLEAVEVFTEKDALRGVIAPVTEKWDVPLGILRGYASETFVYEVAKGLSPDRHTYLYQLGDHDPSGVDAWRSFEEKVRGFRPDACVTFTRLAVTPEQIVAMGLPTRPTKQSDARAKSFVGGSVEVDAIPPTALRKLVEEAILDHLDMDAFDALQAIEAKERAGLAELAAAVARGEIGGGFNVA